MTNIQNKSERGVALLFALFALVILSAIAATLVTMGSTETMVNSNYRSEETAFFAARAGLYEVTDRMMQTNANSIASNIMTATGGPPFGAVVPSSGNGGIFYLINQTTATGTVAPWDITNKYADTELCHEGYTIGTMTNATPDVPCAGTNALPTGSTWYTTVNSNAPWSGTTAALPYVWVRASWKLNNSLPYLTATTTGGVTTTSTSYYSVNGTSSNPVCFNGANEVVLNYPTNTSCNLLTSGSTADTPVFLVTALAITPSGARQMVQTEVAAPPPTFTVTPGGFSDPDGFFAVSNACPAAMTLAGGAQVDGYSSAKVGGVTGTYTGTHSNALGNVGSNGGVTIQGSSSSVPGKIHVLQPVVNGASCATSDIYTTGGPTIGTPTLLSSTYTPPTPTIPPAGSTNETLKKATTLAPGSYGNIAVSTPSGVLTLTGPGTFNVDCLSLGANSTLQISPANTQVVINVTGDASCGGSPISMSANSNVNNTSGVAANLMINYAGTQQVTMIGGPSSYYVLNAPNAPVKLNGGSDFYGALIASTVDDHGGVNLHFDNALTVSPNPSVTTYSSVTSSYNTLGFRSLPY